MNCVGDRVLAELRRRLKVFKEILKQPMIEKTLPDLSPQARALRASQPAGRRARQVARRCPTVTVQAIRPLGPRELAAYEEVRDQWKWQGNK